jgi:hypothetical protein
LQRNKKAERPGAPCPAGGFLLTGITGKFYNALIVSRHFPAEAEAYGSKENKDLSALR